MREPKANRNIALLPPYVPPFIASRGPFFLIRLRSQEGAGEEEEKTSCAVLATDLFFSLFPMPLICCFAINHLLKKEEIWWRKNNQSKKTIKDLSGGEIGERGNNDGKMTFRLCFMQRKIAISLKCSITDTFFRNVPSLPLVALFPLHAVWEWSVSESLPYCYGWIFSPGAQKQVF